VRKIFVVEELQQQVEDNRDFDLINDNVDGFNNEFEKEVCLEEFHLISSKLEKLSEQSDIVNKINNHLISNYDKINVSLECLKPVIEGIAKNLGISYTIPSMEDFHGCYSYHITRKLSLEAGRGFFGEIWYRFCEFIKRIFKTIWGLFAGYDKADEKTVDNVEKLNKELVEAVKKILNNPEKIIENINTQNVASSVDVNNNVSLSDGTTVNQGVSVVDNNIIVITTNNDIIRYIETNNEERAYSIVEIETMLKNTTNRYKKFTDNYNKNIKELLFKFDIINDYYISTIKNIKLYINNDEILDRENDYIETALKDLYGEIDQSSIIDIYKKLFNLQAEDNSENIFKESTPFLIDKIMTLKLEENESIEDNIQIPYKSITLALEDNSKTIREVSDKDVIDFKVGYDKLVTFNSINNTINELNTISITNEKDFKNSSNKFNTIEKVNKELEDLIDILERKNNNTNIETDNNNKSKEIITKLRNALNTLKNIFVIKEYKNVYVTLQKYSNEYSKNKSNILKAAEQLVRKINNELSKVK